MVLLSLTPSITVKPNSPEDSTPLPTLERLQVQRPENIDTQSVVARWMGDSAQAVDSEKIETILSLFVDDASWRDLLAFT